MTKKIYVLTIVSTLCFIMLVIIIWFFLQTMGKYSTAPVYRNPELGYCLRNPEGWSFGEYRDPAYPLISFFRDSLAIEEGATSQTTENLQRGVFVSIGVYTILKEEEQNRIHSLDGLIENSLLGGARRLAQTHWRKISGQPGVVIDIDPVEFNGQTSGGADALYRTEAYVRNGLIIYSFVGFFSNPEIRKQHEENFTFMLDSFDFNGDC